MIDPGLSGRGALITGGNTGIGAAIVRALASQGMRVVIHYLESDDRLPGAFEPAYEAPGRSAAERLVNEVRERGGIAGHVSGNLGHAERAVTLFHEAEGAVGPIDVLVNNAAHCELPDNLLETSADAFDRHFSVNTRAAVLLAREFARRFTVHRGTAGRIINISTDSASAFAGQIAYGASKAALEAFTRSLAIELGPADITVNAVAPGPTQTGWIDSELEAQVLPDVPLGRLGRPEDIADAVVYLASRQADWITGHVLQVSGCHAL